VRWAKAWVVSLWLLKKGQDRIEQNLTSRDQTEFWNLKKSKGMPGNLTQRDRTRMKHLVGNAIHG
jgi:hypothetical protein